MSEIKADGLWGGKVLKDGTVFTNLTSTLGPQMTHWEEFFDEVNRN